MRLGHVPLVLALPLLAAAAGGCSGGMNAREKLVESLTLYTDAVRWQQWDQASNYIAPAQRRAYLERHDALVDLVDISDIEVTRRVVAADGNSATVVIALSWMAKNDPVVKKTVLEQRWDRRGDSWLVGKERRLRGDPLPEPPRRRPPASQPSAPRG